MRFIKWVVNPAILLRRRLEGMMATSSQIFLFVWLSGRRPSALDPAAGKRSSVQVESKTGVVLLDNDTRGALDGLGANSSPVRKKRGSVSWAVPGEEGPLVVERVVPSLHSAFPHRPGHSNPLSPSGTPRSSRACVPLRAAVPFPPAGSSPPSPVHPQPLLPSLLSLYLLIPAVLICPLWRSVRAQRVEAGGGDQT